MPGTLVFRPIYSAFLEQEAKNRGDTIMQTSSIALMTEFFFTILSSLSCRIAVYYYYGLWQVLLMHMLL